MKYPTRIFVSVSLYLLFSYMCWSAPAENTDPLKRTTVEQSFQAIQERLRVLLDEAEGNEWLSRHFRSVKAQIEAEWARSTLQPTAELAETMQHLQSIEAGLRTDAAEWQAYLDGRRSLLVSYTSPYDQSVQFYFLGLPEDWDPSKRYPLYFELHGSGNPHPLSRIAKKLGSTAQAEDSQGYTMPKVYAEIDRSGYWVYPFCRGNLGYRDIAEVDVLETYDHVHELLKIDPDRRYLYGFSMGGGGTWRIAQRTPDRWAAACSFAPSLRNDHDSDHLVANLKLLPYKVMTGTEDFLFPDYHTILKKLQVAEVSNVEARAIDGLSHRYLMELQTEAVEWLKQHQRARSDHFTFTTENDSPPRSRAARPRTNRCWGVSLQIDRPSHSQATATVKRDQQTLSIDTKGAKQVQLDFSSPDGLGITGEVSIVLNGEPVYQGESKPLSFEIR